VGKGVRNRNSSELGPEGPLAGQGGKALFVDSKPMLKKLGAGDASAKGRRGEAFTREKV